MQPYIYGKRNGIHIIDIKETVRGLLRAKKFVTQVVANGSDILFVGTKRQAKGAVEKAAERCGMHCVTERWLGGMLTNSRTIRSRLNRLRELEELIDSPKWETGYSKKMKSMLARELRKIRRNLGGVREMQKLPGALVVIDTRKEHNAIREAQSLGIPTLCLIDTDSDPDAASIPIPGNDDAIRAINVVVESIADSVEEGKKVRVEKEAIAAREEGPGGRRRGGRGRDRDGGDKPAPAEMAQTEAPAGTASA